MDAPRLQDQRLDSGRTLLTAVAILVISSVILVHFKVSLHLDFGAFYFSSKQLLHEGGATLYDFALQQKYQALYHTDPRAYFYYPPIALLPFLPLSFLPINAAYVCWTLLSVAMLVVSIWILTRLYPVLPSTTAISAALLFPPVLWCLMHGQTSLLALLLYTVAFRFVHSGKELHAGLVLSLLLFKFQLVLPFMLCVLLARKWRMLAGFAMGAAAVILASYAMIGPTGVSLYRQALSAMSHANASVFPREMASYRGLAYLISGRDPSVAIIGAASLATCVFASIPWRKNWQIGFSLAIVASLLSGYHLNPQDVALLLVPLFVAASVFSARSRTLIAVFASPLSFLLFLALLGALATVPILALFVGLYRVSLRTVLPAQHSYSAVGAQ